MPRPRKPLSQQKGNLTVLQKNKKQLEEQAVKVKKDRLINPPEFLNGDIAVEEWKAVVEELRDIEIIGNLDIGNLMVYCNAFADYIEATNRCNNEPKVIEKEGRYGTMLVKNPWVELQKSYADEMRKAGSKCGIDINSRLKAATVKVNETQEKIEAKFGI